MARTKQEKGRDELAESLREHFGLESFREGQREVVETVLGGRHGLVVMPTGGGKSLCYQLPALLLPGLTLVVSPLIALMKDQVDALMERGLPAALVNSSQSLEDQRRCLASVAAGRIKLLFVAPERFRSEPFWEALAGVPVSLLAVDEAHCISHWGHDFRPDYLGLGDVRGRLGQPVTLALTATATPRVRQDIVDRLGIGGASVFVSGFERENLLFQVRRAASHGDKLAFLREALSSLDGSAIVYCTTRKAVREVAEQLAGQIPSVGYYHAGLADEERADVQDDFMDGAVQVLVATNAFGMGVDKPDIRATVHYQMPASLEAYYQEAGRAGRDGQPARCLLLYNYADRKVLDFFIEHNNPSRGVVLPVWRSLRRLARGTEPIDRELLLANLPRHIHDMSLDAALRLLDRAGHARLDRRHGQARITVLDQVLPEKLRIDWDELDARRADEEARLERVIAYAASKRCRTADILRYFGASRRQKGSCGHCDNCSGSRRLSLRGPATRRAEVAGGRPGRAAGAEEPGLVCRKIAACVARCRQAESARTVAQVLVGSRSQRLRGRGLDRLSTYGILAGLSRRQVEQVIAVLLAADFLIARGPALGLSPLAVAVMKGEVGLPEGLAARLAASLP